MMASDQYFSWILIRASAIALLLPLGLGVSGCSTMVKPGPMEQIRLDALREFSCLPVDATTFRLNLFNSAGLLGAFDVEDSGSGDSRQIAVLSDTMQELVVLDFDSRMKMSKTVEFFIGEQSVRLKSDSVLIDSHQIPIGPGEFHCLMSGRLPIWWLDQYVDGYQADDQRFIVQARNRKIAYKVLSGGKLDVLISWRSSWFSWHEIHVLSFRETGSSAGGRTGELRGPSGVVVKWIEI